MEVRCQCHSANAIKSPYFVKYACRGCIIEICNQYFYPLGTKCDLNFNVNFNTIMPLSFVLEKAVK